MDQSLLPPAVRLFGRITLSGVNLQMPTTCLGGRRTHSSSFRKLQVSVYLSTADFPGRAEEGSPPSSSGQGSSS